MNKPFALLSVFDKTGIVDLAGRLQQNGYGIISTGGTLLALQAGGIEGVIPIEDFTSFPECLDGRLKTLHPMVHGSLLHLRDDSDHVQTAKKRGFVDLRVLVVNLYPFQQVIAKPGCTLETAIENIDIGGPAMLRAAAKNWKHVYSVVDPADYTELVRSIITEHVTSNDPGLKPLRYRLATKVYKHCAKYDEAVGSYLGSHTCGL